MRYSALLELAKEMEGSATIETIDKADQNEDFNLHFEMISHDHHEKVLLLINKYFYKINNFYADEIAVGDEGEQLALFISFDCKVRYDYR